MEIIEFLFETRTGVFVLIFGGMALFALIAFLLERRTHKMYFNRPKREDDDDDWGLFNWSMDDDEDEKDEDV